jgi:ribosome biogenesis GTPase A
VWDKTIFLAKDLRMNQKQNHWYPGHMNKAIKAIHEKIKWIDLLVVLVDARAVYPCMDLPLVSQKAKLFVITKSDLADPNTTSQWVKQLKAEQKPVVVSLGKVSGTRALILKALHELGEPLWLKQEKKGFKRQPLKVMITGVPNVGKSTLINLLAKQHRVATENRPGSTRGQQWIKLDDHLMLLDTPGILPPRFQSKATSIQLALIGSMPLKQLPIEDLADHLFHWLQAHYPTQLTSIHGEGPLDAKSFFDRIATKRGWVKQGVVDYPLVYMTFIKSFQDGNLGRFSLSRLTDDHQS